MVTHIEEAVVEGVKTKIGRDPRHMTVEELNELGHKATPLLDVIRTNCVDCAGGSVAEVRCCAMIQCPFWSYRMGNNPFRTRELSDEQRLVLVDRMARARENRAPRQKTESQGPLVTVNQRQALSLVANRQYKKWDELHGKTRNSVVKAGWVNAEGKKPVLTEQGEKLAREIGLIVN